MRAWWVVRAFLCVAQIPRASLPQSGCSSGFDLCTRHVHTVGRVHRARGHLFASQLHNGRPNCAARKFPQERRSRATSRRRRARRRRWATPLVKRARPHDSGSGPCMLAPPPVARTPINLFNSHCRPAMISSPTVSTCFNVVRLLDPGEPYCTGTRTGTEPRCRLVRTGHRSITLSVGTPIPSVLCVASALSAQRRASVET